MSAVIRLALIVAITGFIPHTAVAQRSVSIVAGIRSPSSPLSSGGVGVRARNGNAGESGRSVSMANGALIGAGIGIAVGLVASPIVNSQNSDHSEDAMTYIVLPAFGAFLGLIIGGIVGWRRAG